MNFPARLNDGMIDIYEEAFDKFSDETENVAALKQRGNKSRRDRPVRAVQVSLYEYIIPA